MRRAVWPFLLSVAVVGVLFLFVFPARTYLAQRHDLAAAESRVRVLGTQNKVLSDEAAKLQDDTEIERLARSQFGLVKPGEVAYAILPPPPPPAASPQPAAAVRRPATPDWAIRILHGLL
jgi:cell division protein FtsB